MKIRSRGLIRTLAWLGAAVGRALFRSVRTVVRPALAGTSPYEDTGDERFLVEPIGRAWVLAGFSGHGFKFAPAVGEMLARTLAGALAPAAMTAWAAGRT